MLALVYHSKFQHTYNILDDLLCLLVLCSGLQDCFDIFLEAQCLQSPRNVIASNSLLGLLF